MAYQDYFDQVQQLYIAFYQRPADPDGLYYWAQRLEVAGGSLEGIIDAFATSAEAVSLYDTNGDGKLDGNDNMTVLVTAIYQALFNRAPDQTGLQFYVDALTSGSFPDGRPATPGRVALDILNGAQNDDRILVNNKTEAAMRFTETLDPGLDGQNYQATYAGEADAQQGRDFLGGVGVVRSSIPDQAETTKFIQDHVADSGDPIVSPPAGQTFTLTTALSETINGSAGDDTITGLMDGTNNTFNFNDQIDGGGGVDTLNLYVGTGPQTAPLGASVKNVEVINIISDGGGTFDTDGTDIDAEFFKGATQIWQKGLTSGGASIYNVGAGVTVGFANTSVNNTVVVADGVNAANVVIDKVGTGSTIVFDETTPGDLKAVTVTGSVVGAAALTVDSNNIVETINLALTSNSHVTFTNTTGLTTIDASASTGDLTFDLENDGVTTVTTVVLGSGDDTLTLYQSGPSPDVTVTGGAGRDIIDVTQSGGGEVATLVFNAGDTGITLATADSITGFTSGEDKLDFNLTAGSKSTFLNGGTVDNFYTALSNANNQFIGTVQYFWSDDGTNGYLFVDRNGDGKADEAIILVSVTSIDAKDIIA